MTSIVLFQRGPQDLPFSRSLCVTAVFVTVLIMVLRLEVGGILTTNELVKLFASLAVFSACVFLLLALFDKLQRLTQTLSASFGAAVIFSLVELTFAIVYPPKPEDPLWFYIAVGLLLWSLAVDGHILRHALDISWAKGIVLAVTIVVPQIMVISILSGPA